MKQTIRPLAILTTILLCLCGIAQAQVTGAKLEGTVVDPTGAAISKAKIVVTNSGTNQSSSATSDDRGLYSIPALTPGTYQLSASAAGFASTVQTGITLTVGQNATLNIALKLGSSNETTTVTADAELINASTADISQVVNEDEIKDLPLNGRDPSSLVNLAAGVTNELFSQASTLPGNNSFSTESGASAGGGRQGSTWYLLDGVANMDTFALLAAPFPNADATQEFRVISNN